MPKKLLISYVGKTPVEIDLAGAMKREEVKAKKEKREVAFERLAAVRSGTLTLRKNTTAVVSPSELGAVKEALGERFYARYVVEHGEYSPQGPVAKRVPQKAPRAPSGNPGPKGDSPEPPAVTVSGKGGKKKAEGK